MRTVLSSSNFCCTLKCRHVFRTLWNIYKGAFCKNSHWTVNSLRKKLYASEVYTLKHYLNNIPEQFSIIYFCGEEFFNTFCTNCHRLVTIVGPSTQAHQWDLAGFVSWGDFVWFWLLDFLNNSQLLTKTSKKKHMH